MATDDGLSFTTRRVGDALVLDHRGGGCRPASDVEIECVAEIERLRARVAELEGALRPFAIYARVRERSETTKTATLDSYTLCQYHTAVVTLGDIRRARSVLSGTPSARVAQRSEQAT